MKNTWLLILLFICSFFSCRNDRVAHDLMNRAEGFIEADPDSAYTLLNSIEVPDNLNDRQFARWCMLYGQAADKLFKEVFKAKEEVCQETGTGKKIQDAGHLEDEKMWKVDRNFLEKAEEEDFCFVEGENLAGYEGKITEIVLYKWNRDYPADVFFEVDLSKWRLEERKDFSGYSHEKITKEIYNRQGLL